MAERQTETVHLLQDTLVVLENNLPDLMNDYCNPLDLTIPLIEGNGSSLSVNEFLKLKKQFAKNLQKAVNANYMTFNDSIGSYGISVETLNQSQDKLGQIRDCLNSVNEILNYKSNILGELNAKSMEHSQVLLIMEKINELKNNLKLLQTFIENQEFEKGVNLVKDIVESTNENKLFKIESLQSLQLKLDSFINLLLDGLIDEIGGYIYMKDSSNFNSLININSGRVPINKGLLGFIKKLNQNMIDEDEELQVFNGKYDELFDRFKLVQKLNKESECLSRLVNNSEKEIKHIINLCVNEVKNKYPSQIEMNLTSTDLNDKNSTFSTFNLLQGMNGLIIREVFSNIFNKLLFLMQRHIAIYEISKKKGYRYNIEKIWDQVQKQISLMICNYIIDIKLLNDLDELDLKTSNNKNKNSPFNKTPKQFQDFENGPIFQFSKLSLNSLSNDLINSLNNIFINQGKGLTINEFNVVNNSIFIGIDDINESKKNIVVPSNIFNMAYIIEEFVDFIDRLKSIYKINLNNEAEDKNTVTNFFNQFMDLVFVSQLENTLIYQFDKLCENKWESDNLLKSSLSFNQFFNRVLILLDTTLYYRPSYVKIVFKLFNEMVSKFKQSKESLLRNNERLLNKWINDSKLKNVTNSIVDNLLKDENDIENLEDLQSNELTYALSSGENFISTINPKNFITLEHMRSLVDLLASLLNILSWLPNMKHKVPDTFKDVGLYQELNETWVLSIFNDTEFPLSSVNLDNDIEDNQFNNEFDDISLNNFDNSNELRGFLALNSKSEIEFDKLVKDFENLMNDVEIFIKYEIKVECVFYMIQMMYKQQWKQKGDETVDLGISKFCERVNGISRIFNVVSKNIINESKEEVRIRIFSGLGYWIDRLSIFESRRIETISNSGWVKMIVNLRVLQQVIRNIDFIDIESNFNINKNIMKNSLKYFTIGMEGERSLNNIDKIRKGDKLKLTDDDWKNLVRLIYSEKLENDTTGSANKKYMAAQARLLKNLATKL